MKFPTVSIVPEVNDRSIAVLRLLGRLEYALTPYLWKLLYAPVGLSDETMYRQLNALYDLGYVWRIKASLRPRTRTTSRPGERMSKEERAEFTPLNPPHVWGLTPEGRNYLALQEVEPDEKSLEGLKTRDRRAPKVPLATLGHDLQASWWCCGVIHEAMRCPYLQDLFVQVEFVSLTHAQRADDGMGQRIDALVGLRFDPDRDPQRGRHHPGIIPWYDGFPRSGRQWWEWFALEVDRGTEALKVLLGKATVYRDMSVSKVYRSQLDGDLLPVFLVPSKRRAGQIAREWQDAWPDGKGVIATLQQAEHPEHGTLWGTYPQLRNGKVSQPLLQKWTLEEWVGLCQ